MRRLKGMVRYAGAAIHAIAGLALLSMSVDPYVGSLKDFHFPCEPCGWHYETKLTYFLTFAVPGALLLVSSGIAWRSRSWRFMFLGLALLPAMVYLWGFALSRPA